MHHPTARLPRKEHKGLACTSTPTDYPLRFPAPRAERRLCEQEQEPDLYQRSHTPSLS